MFSLSAANYFHKSSILDAPLGPEYAFVLCSSKYFDVIIISHNHILIMLVVLVLCMLMVCFWDDFIVFNFRNFCAANK